MAHFMKCCYKKKTEHHRQITRRELKIKNFEGNKLILSKTCF